MPFSVFMGPFIDKISQQEKEVEACAQMATMERIVGTLQSLEFSRLVPIMHFPKAREKYYLIHN